LNEPTAHESADEEESEEEHQPQSEYGSDINTYPKKMQRTPQPKAYNVKMKSPHALYLYLRQQYGMTVIPRVKKMRNT